SHGGLRVLKPSLEVVQISKKSVQITSLAQFGIAELDQLVQLLEDGRYLSDALSDLFRLFRMLFLDSLGLALEVVHLSADGGQISLHTAESSLESHDTGQIVAKLFGGLKQFSLLLDPRD